MKAALLKRLFKAIHEIDDKNLRQIASVIIEEERKKGHEILANQLESIISSPISVPKLELISNKNETKNNTKNFIQLPTDRRYNQPLATLIPHSELEHHMVLPDHIEKRFATIEREYAARERLAKYGLRPRRKILLYGSPGCGKTLGAQRLAWNTGLPLLKVRFDTIISSYLGESAANLRTIFEAAETSPCLLLLDECDFIARSRTSSQDVGEIPRIVNTLLQLLDEYNGKGLLVATTNLQTTLDKALFRRFDDAFEIPKPGRSQIEKLIKMTLSLMKVSNNIDWQQIVKKLEGFSSADVVKIAQNAAKESILQNKDLVEFENLLNAIEQLEKYENGMR